MRISDWSSDVCSSDLRTPQGGKQRAQGTRNPTAIKHYHRKGLVHVIDDPPAIPLQHETEQDEVGVVQVIDVVAVSQTVDEQPRQAEQEAARSRRRRSVLDEARPARQPHAVRAVEAQDGYVVACSTEGR